MEPCSLQNQRVFVILLHSISHIKELLVNRAVLHHSSALQALVDNMCGKLLNFYSCGNLSVVFTAVSLKLQIDNYPVWYPCSPAFHRKAGSNLVALCTLFMSY